MNNEIQNERKMTNVFERYLTIWVGLCIVGGIILGKLAPELSKTLDSMAIYVNGDSSIRGVDCHHVLLSGPLVDLQIWIEKGDKPTPRRTLMTYRHGQGMPRNEVFLEWSAVDSFSKSEFEFVPPEGAAEIGFVKAP